MKEQIDPMHARMHDLALLLMDAQRREHDGSGVEIIRTIAAELRNGNLDEARKIADWEWNTIARYSDIRDLVEQHLFR